MFTAGWTITPLSYLHVTSSLSTVPLTWLLRNFYCALTLDSTYSDPTLLVTLHTTHVVCLLLEPSFLSKLLPVRY